MTSQELQRHNQTVLDTLEEGDLLEFDRGLYSHWAVYVGKCSITKILMQTLVFISCCMLNTVLIIFEEYDSGNMEVVHLSGDDGQMGSNLGHSCSISGVESDKGIIRKDRFWDVVGDSKCCSVVSRHLEPSKIVKRALSKPGEVGYNLLLKNCEHFASWCRYDKEESDQADGLFTALAVGGAAVVVAGLAVWFGRDGKKEREKQSEY
ncbi:phospholipase A and acyltransferase 1-like [Haliotis rubra]|uniref:phospholipase A and acyltransferase 1-like n=1 Tax=Haliotis rubra TaxID=36100 RepID=UPI001EE5E699|nr:phospholipase A and acyltransferase 1-like [Haliotis rubra]